MFMKLMDHDMKGYQASTIILQAIFQVLNFVDVSRNWMFSNLNVPRNCIIFLVSFF